MGAEERRVVQGLWERRGISGARLQRPDREGKPPGEGAEDSPGVEEHNTTMK